MATPDKKLAAEGQIYAVGPVVRDVGGRMHAYRPAHIRKDALPCIVRDDGWSHVVCPNVNGNTPAVVQENAVHIILDTDSHDEHRTAVVGE